MFVLIDFLHLCATQTFFVCDKEPFTIMCHRTNTIRPCERFPARRLLTGVSQQSSDTSGSLISRFKSVGNFIKVELVKQTGQWSLEIMSTHPYNLKVIGETFAVLNRI